MALSASVLTSAWHLVGLQSTEDPTQLALPTLGWGVWVESCEEGP